MWPITLPAGAVNIINKLEAQGHETYAVGGCVRDSLLGRAPTDWDIASSARPEQVTACFEHVINSGLKHGTVTVSAGGQHFEVTTFRSDGAYRDNRRPERVEFIGSVDEDLSRRDFTVNAMAYHPARGLRDPYGGVEDMQKKRIRAVGAPEQRFGEDGLRIMRALRFAATLGFTIEPDTAAAILRERQLLRNISAERLREELIKTLTGPGATEVLDQYAVVVAEIIPELTPMFGFEQHNPYHHLDVWQHTLAAVTAAPPDTVIRLALLLHDIGKPACFAPGKDGTAHFYGHAAKSSQLAEAVLRRLRFDKATAAAVRELVFYHDAEIPPTDKALKRWLNRLGEAQLQRLLLVKQADAVAHHPQRRQRRIERLAEVNDRLTALLATAPCFSLRDLAVDGRDMLALGIAEGAAIGRALDYLLAQVLDEQLPNDRAALLTAARDFITQPALSAAPD